MKNILFIRDKLITEYRLTANEYLVYIGFLLLVRKNENLYYVNVDLMAYLLTKTYPCRNRLDKNISEGISGLISKGLVRQIKYGDYEKKDEWIVDLNDFKVANEKKEKGFYTVLDELDVQTILMMNEKYYSRSISLIKFYAYLLSTIFKSGRYKGVGFTSIDELASTSGCSAKTISSYLKSLEEMNLIFVYKSSDFIKFDTGEFVEISHTYGRYKDKELVESMGRQHEEEYGEKLKSKHQKIKKKNSNKNRGYAQKFNHLYKCMMDTGEIPYRKDECKKIYIAMKRLNDIYENERPNKPKKDLSIFSNFDFYEE